VYDLCDTGGVAADQLGRTGTELAELIGLGLPVPPGFVLTARACHAYLAAQEVPTELAEPVRAHLHELARRAGRKLGQSDDPLLLSLHADRPGSGQDAPAAPVRGIGLTDASVAGFIAAGGDERAVWDLYQRLVAAYGTVVAGIPAEKFEAELTRADWACGQAEQFCSGAAELPALVAAHKRVLREQTGREFPQDPNEVLESFVRATFDSWAVNGRGRRPLVTSGGALTISTMVFGHLGVDSGIGVAHTRDPGSGRPGVRGHYLPGARAGNLVSGPRGADSLARLARLNPDAHQRLLTISSIVDEHFRDLCDIDFVVERGRLWVLRAGPGRRGAAAAFRIAMALHDEGVIDDDEALCRVTGEQLTQLLFPRFDPGVPGQRVATGVAASPGAAVGQVVFDSVTAVSWAKAGRPVILVRTHTTQDDLPGMSLARGVLTSRGGQTSHAAVTARGLGRTCVTGADQLSVDTGGHRFTAPGGVLVREGDTVSIDGATGAVCLGEVPVVPSPVVEYFEGEIEPDADAVVHAVHRILRYADRRRVLAVRANADTPADAARARRFGADGIGLCRTEQMFSSDRRALIERLIVAEPDDHHERADVLAELLPLQRQDFQQIFRAMDGRPVTVRLLDPPLHEFLPDLTELSVRVALAEAGGAAEVADVWLLRVARRLHEHNPMLGLRGVRLGLVVPGLYEMQVRAIAEAAAACVTEGGRPRVEIMVPLVADATELAVVRERAEAVLAEVREHTGIDLPAAIGTMIELPRAALTAGRIAEHAQFFSFGTNDLTQTAWGMSRDDAESEFLPEYRAQGILTGSPFSSIDEEGVGRLITLATGEGRAARPDLHVGVCGEHGGDPESIHFFHRLRIDHVSCSPFRVPIARLEAGRAAACYPLPSVG
jgi:pyruvate,orthophosphate dikinase